MAAIAEAPQMATPVPMSRLRGPPNRIRRPSQAVNVIVATSVVTTMAMTGTPSAAMELNDTEKPSSITPTRSSFLVSAPEPGPARGQQVEVGGDDAEADGPGEHAHRRHQPVRRAGRTPRPAASTASRRHHSGPAWPMPAVATRRPRRPRSRADCRRELASGARTVRA